MFLIFSCWGREEVYELSVVIFWIFFLFRSDFGKKWKKDWRKKKGVKRIDTNFCESFYFAAFAVYESYIVLLLLTRQRLARDWLNQGSVWVFRFSISILRLLNLDAKPVHGNYTKDVVVLPVHSNEVVRSRVPRIRAGNTRSRSWEGNEIEREEEEEEEERKKAVSVSI